MVVLLRPLTRELTPCSHKTVLGTKLPNYLLIDISGTTPNYSYQYHVSTMVLTAF